MNAFAGWRSGPASLLHCRYSPNDNFALCPLWPAERHSSPRRHPCRPAQKPNLRNSGPQARVRLPGVPCGPRAPASLRPLASRVIGGDHRPWPLPSAPSLQGFSAPSRSHRADGNASCRAPANSGTSSTIGGTPLATPRGPRDIARRHFVVFGHCTVGVFASAWRLVESQFLI